MPGKRYTNKEIIESLDELNRNTNKEIIEKLEKIEKGGVKSGMHIDYLITEYNVLRKEITQKFNHQLNIFGIIVSALAAIYGLIFAYRIYDLVLIIPIIIFPLALRFQYTNYGVGKIGEYLLQIEKQITTILDPRNKYYFNDDEITNFIKEKNPNINKYHRGWQSYWKYFLETSKPVKRFDFTSKFLLFLFIPILIIFCYSLTVWLSYFDNLLFDIIFNNNIQIPKIIQQSTLFNVYVYGIISAISFIVLIGLIVYWFFKKCK